MPYRKFDGLIDDCAVVMVGNIGFTPLSRASTTRRVDPTTTVIGSTQVHSLSLVHDAGCSGKTIMRERHDQKASDNRCLIIAVCHRKKC